MYFHFYAIPWKKENLGLPETPSLSPPIGPRVGDREPSLNDCSA